jgi:hypothetical protein
VLFHHNSVTITNPNGCNSFGNFTNLNVAFGSGSTWTYSKTIGGVTTSGAYDTFGGTFETGSLGTGDSFTLNLTSAASDEIQFYNSELERFFVHFNNQVENFDPSPVVIGRQVTVTGSNLSGVTSLILQGPVYFGVMTSDRTATQLTFTVPLTVFDFMSQLTINVTPGSYRMSSAPGKTLTLTAAPVVALISAEELARQARVAANAQREIDKRSARDEISSDFKRFIGIKLEIFKQAEIKGSCCCTPKQPPSHGQKRHAFLPQSIRTRIQ